MINTIASLWRDKIYICPCKNNLFLEAHSFHRALLSENCSHLGTDNVRGQILALILALNKGYCLFSNWVDNVIVVEILIFYSY